MCWCVAAQVRGTGMNKLVSGHPQNAVLGLDVDSAGGIFGVCVCILGEMKAWRSAWSHGGFNSTFLCTLIANVYNLLRVIIYISFQTGCRDALRGRLMGWCVYKHDPHQAVPDGGFPHPTHPVCPPGGFSSRQAAPRSPPALIPRVACKIE